jgi:hypothetical protein
MTASTPKRFAYANLRLSNNFLKIDKDKRGLK